MVEDIRVTNYLRGQHNALLSTFTKVQAPMKRFLVSYRHDGSQWNIELPANDLDDARQRLGRLVFGQLDGEIVLKVPGSLGPLAVLGVWVRNLLCR